MNYCVHHKQLWQRDDEKSTLKMVTQQQAVVELSVSHREHLILTGCGR